MFVGEEQKLKLLKALEADVKVTNTFIYNIPDYYAYVLVFCFLYDADNNSWFVVNIHILNVLHMVVLYSDHGFSSEMWVSHKMGWYCSPCYIIHKCKEK